MSWWEVLLAALGGYTIGSLGAAFAWYLHHKRGGS
jgi:hypothetical protein